MNALRQRWSAKGTQNLRREAGSWLRELREKRGLSQRELAQNVGAEYYTFISQLENGRGRIPPNRYLLWARALGVEPKVFVQTLMSYYDPVTYDTIFGRQSRRALVPANKTPAAGGGGHGRNDPILNFPSIARVAREGKSTFRET
jgi:transcriptional regulator with XRE-family HTH domain